MANMEKVRLFPVDDEAIKAILSLFGRTEGSFNEDVNTVEEWMKTQPHLPEILDKDRIANFLTLNKCSIEKTKQKIDMYYTLRSLIPDMFENANPELPNMRRLTDIVYWLPISKLTTEMYRVFVFKLRDKALEPKLEPLDVIGQFFNLYEIRIKEDHILGDVMIADMEGITMTYMLKVTPTLVRNFVAIYEKIYTISLKAMYIINSGPVIRLVMDLLKFALKPKIFQRIHVCQDSSILKERLALDVIPQDYGGNAPSCEEIHETTKLKFAEYKERFDQLDKLRVDEKLRPEKLENDDVLGFHGNFKKLSVD